MIKLIPMHIYIYTNMMNMKKYVGQTICVPPIWRHYQHTTRAKKKPNKNDMLITRAIRKYGIENFTIDFFPLSGEQTQERLNRAEVQAIKKHNSIFPNGYNFKEGGSHGKHLEGTKEKMKGRPAWNKGISPTQTTKNAMSRAKKGIPRGPTPQATKDAISASQKGIPRGPMSQQNKDAISASHKGIPWSTARRAAHDTRSSHT